MLIVLVVSAGVEVVLYAGLADSVAGASSGGWNVWGLAVMFGVFMLFSSY